MRFKVFVYILLAIGITGCQEKRSHTRSAGFDQSEVKPALSPLPERPLSPDLERLRKSASEDAARVRELGFTSDVGMTELTGWEYGTRTSEMAKVLGGEQLRSLGRLAAAGGIIPEGTDLGSLAATFAAMSASANYSPLDKRVILVSKFKDKSLLVHEFTHALQDQHFDLMKLLAGRPFDFDRSEALFALIEGDAMNVQRRFEDVKAYENLPLDAIAKQEDLRFDEYRKTVGEFFQPLLTETFVFRYRDGARFVEAVRRQQGERGVNQLFVNPPVSSEQILHHDKYLAGERPKAVDVDESAFLGNGWTLTTSTPLGEIGVRGLLLAGVPAKVANGAAAGWGGDRALLFEKAGSAPLFVWKTVWDKPSDAGEFFVAYKALKEHLREDESFVSNGEIQWRANGYTTILKRVGDTVQIVRGSEVDATWASGLGL
jgi:hypothetical protein